jgi:LmbE family N-acetylglucosaminyl deacetylase
VLVISPHLDDAVFSCGQLVAAHPGASIVTVLAGEPPGSQPLTEWDAASGFSSAGEALRARLAEDAAGCAAIGAARTCLDLLDGQYERPPGHDERLRAELERVIGEHAGGSVYVPLGIRHPDHQLVGDTARDVCAALGAPVVVYEDLPYRVEEPDEHAAARARVHEAGWLLEERVETLGSLGAKSAAIDCYVSQAGLFERANLLAAEQYFTAARSPRRCR